jgi:hypothetical protein
MSGHLEEYKLFLAQNHPPTYEKYFRIHSEIAENSEMFVVSRRIELAYSLDF